MSGRRGVQLSELCIAGFGRLLVIEIANEVITDMQPTFLCSYVNRRRLGNVEMCQSIYQIGSFVRRRYNKYSQ